MSKLIAAEIGMHQARQFDANTADASDLVRPEACIDPRHLDIHSPGTVFQPCQEDPSALLAMLEAFRSKNPSAFHAMLEALRPKIAQVLPQTDPINLLPGPAQRSGFYDDFVHRDASSTISHQGGAVHQLPYQLPFTLMGNSGEFAVSESPAGTIR